MCPVKLIKCSEVKVQELIVVTRGSSEDDFVYCRRAIEDQPFRSSTNEVIPTNELWIHPDIMMYKDDIEALLFNE